MANGITYTCSTLVSGGASGGFDDIHPVAVAVDKSGKVYVTSDLNLNTVQVYDAAGAFLTSFGGCNGSRSGDLCMAEGIAVDQNGNIFVTDVMNQRVQKFAPGVPGWRQANLNGFLDPTAGIFSLETFNGYLYAGTINFSGKGSIVMRSPDGTTWTPASAYNFGSTDTLTGVVDMVVFNGWLYAASGWGDLQTSAQMWRTQDGTTWQPVETHGFGIANAWNIGPFAISTVGGKTYLYAAVQNRVDGASLFRSDSGEPGSWAAVVTGDPSMYAIDGFAEWNDQLFATTEAQTSGGRVWVTTNGSQWDLFGPPGLGDDNNTQLGAPAVFKDHLYVPTYNTVTGAQIFRLDNGTTWTRVVADGFGNVLNEKIDGLLVWGGKLIAKVNNRTEGMSVMSSEDGLSWTAIAPQGFGNSHTVISLWADDNAEFKGALYIGTINTTNGGQIWAYMDKTLFIPVIKR